MNDDQYIDIAIEISKKSNYPYGAFIVKDNQIIYRSNDKTFNLNKYILTHKNLYGDLKGAIMYVSCKPCMMCMCNFV